MWTISSLGNDGPAITIEMLSLRLGAVIYERRFPCLPVLRIFSELAALDEAYALEPSVPGMNSLLTPLV